MTAYRAVPEAAPAGGVMQQAGSAPPIVDEVLRAGGGQTLDQLTRDFFEPKFGYDFGAVRIHTDGRSASAAAAVNARAFTVGQDVFFGTSQHRPHDTEGRALLAHELTHVVQQGAAAGLGTAQIQRAGPPSGPPPTTCTLDDVFAELDPGTVLPSAYFRNGEATKKDDYKSELSKAKAKSGTCVTRASFDGIPLNWDLGNPKLGSWYGFNLNKGSKRFDIVADLVYRAAACCSCFNGTLSWNFDVDARRKTETGKTATPITGSKTLSDCKGTACCSVAKDFSIALWLGDKDVDVNFKGKLKLAGQLVGR
jgi:hypothetical protein